MAGPSNDNGDVSKHLVIGKSINIEFKKARKPSERLEVVFNGDLIPTNFQNADGLTRRWTLDREIHIFLNSNDSISDTLTLRVGGKKKKLFKGLATRNDKLDEFKLTSEKVADKFKHSSSIQFPGQNCTVILNVATGSIEGILATESSEELEPLLHVPSFIASGDSFVKNVRSLGSILENIPVAENALEVMENTVDTLGNAYPLAKAVLKALSIPYRLLRNEHKFKKNVKELAEAMYSTFKCLMDVRFHTKITSAKELYVSIMKILWGAATFIDIYRRKDRFRQFVGAQFPQKIDNYSEELIKQKNQFQMAMVLQIARDVDMMASMTSDDFLRRRLRPTGTEEQRSNHGCLEGTRVNILRDVKDWLQDSESKNILWIVGAPGAGKSTIAATIAEKPADTVPFCSKFFCKRDVENFRDPRRIWRTLAYNLANKHDGVKAALMASLIDKRIGDPLEISVCKQFENLIKSPLETDLKETSFRSPQTVYPVIIIDALDECDSADDYSWRSLLDSLKCWSELPGAFKLIVTSRDLHDIRMALGEFSDRIDLTTGDSVSDDSKSDIEIFFMKKFGEIRDSFSSLSGWPKEEVLRAMTEYAAGLFIWADMVIKYVGHRAVGRNPVKRLEDLLSDIKPQAGNQRGNTEVLDGRDQVDRLYARIVFEAFRQSTPGEREMAKRVLAAIVLAKESLRKCDLLELLLTDTSDSNDVLASIESTLRELSPIIPVSDHADDKLRVCHKTVSDFLLSSDRSSAALTIVVKNWTPQSPDDLIPDPHSFIIDLEKDNKGLALACVALARRTFSLDILGIASLLNQSNGPLDYAHQHWFEHLESGGGSRIRNLKCLADAMKLAYGRLQRYAPQMVLAEEATIALVASLRDAADFASQCINGVSTEHPIAGLQQELEEHAKKLDIARGKFQIAMILNLASDIDESALDAPDIFLRKRLEPSSQSLLDDECLEGTRTNVLQQAKDWLDDTELPNILWISGAPGAGKSAIATSLAKRFSSQGLCAKVVAKRDFADRRDPRRVWRTLVYNLASLHAGLKGSIMEALSEKSDYSQDEFRDLIVEAVEDQQYLSVVVVIDALDECFTEDNEDWKELLQSITGWADLPRTFRLVVTSRDIPDIRRALMEGSYHISLTTGAKASIESKLDTMIFFRAKFAEMRKDVKYMPSNWPDDKVVQQLAEYAAGSFIWAKMVVELVGKLGPQTVDHLEDMLSGAEVGSVKLMDNLYAKMLFDIFAPLDDKGRKASRSILAAIVLARDPLRKSDLVELLSSSGASTEETHQSVETAVDQLSCVLSMGDKHLRIPHKSFADFLLDHDRSLAAMRHVMPLAEDQDLHSYLINHKEDCANMAIACLGVMNRLLVFNPCGINNSYCLNDEIPKLEALVSKNISTALIYACRFWTKHLTDSPRNDRLLCEVPPLLKILLREKVLHWLEFLSLVKAIPSAEESLTAAADFLKGYDDGLAEVAKDASEFASSFEVPIAAAATHIYISALPFCPSNSWMAQLYGQQYPNLLSVTSGRRVNWDEAATTSDGHDDEVNSVAFFPDGRKLASGSDDRTVRVWDSKTGKATSAPFTGHTSYVWSVAVSPDGKLIASGSNDDTLRIWDSNTGACPLGPIAAHSDNIQSVAFSPDGSRIVTGSQDSTLKVWNVATGDLSLGPLTGHTKRVNSVAFSPDGTCIASGSSDRTVRVWDASTGESCTEPLIGHTGEVNCVAFSAGGHYLASGSDDETIRLWDVTQEFAEIAATHTLGSTVRSLSFSPTSNRLVSGFDDGTLRFWNINSGNLKQIGEAIYGHSGAVWSVAFSPDGLSVASGSRDKSIKIWTVPTTSTRPPAAANSDRNTENSPNETISGFLDRRGNPVLSNTSYIDRDGWMRDSRGEDSRRLFWVPRENRNFFWRPRNTSVMVDDIVTQVDFTRFVHGDNWAECRLEVV